MIFQACKYQLTMTKGVLGSIFCVLDDFLDISKSLFCFSCNLFLDALGFLFLVANQFAGFFLNFTGKVFDSALDLILVHVGIPLKVNECLRSRASGGLAVEYYEVDAS